MALVVTVAAGDVVDIGNKWIALLSVQSGVSATLISDAGNKISVSAEIETEVMPSVWLRLGSRAAYRSCCQLVIDAPKAVRISRRQNGRGLESSLSVNDGTPKNRPSR